MPRRREAIADYVLDNWVMLVIGSSSPLLGHAVASFPMDRTYDGEVFEACSLMFPGSVPALDNRDTISNRTRRHCVFRVDGEPRCRRAVQVAVCETSERSVLSYWWCW
jgi:hypothetical protein